MNFIKKIIYIFGLLLLCGCNNNFYDAQQENTKFLTIQKEENTHVFYGIVKSQTVSNLSFETEGKIEYLPYTKGDFVQKGEIIAKLNGELYNIKKREQQNRVQNARIKLEQLKSNYERMDILHKEGAISDNDWEDAYYSLKSQEQEIEIEKAALNYINKEISLNTLKAPYSGYIEEKFANIGAYAKIGQPILTLISNTQTQIEAIIQSEYINKLYLNQKVTIKKDNINHSGKITHISTVSSKSGGYIVKIYLDKIDHSLKDGMSVDVIIPFKDEEKILIPLNALQEENNKEYVYLVLNKNKNYAELKKRAVNSKPYDFEKIEIKSGLKKDDVILLNNFDQIKHSKIKL